MRRSQQPGKETFGNFGLSKRSLLAATKLGRRLLCAENIQVSACGEAALNMSGMIRMLYGQIGFASRLEAGASDYISKPFDTDRVLLLLYTCAI